MRPQDIERERTCFRVLREISGRECILIGGYEVSAFGPSRFSVDVDLVQLPSELPALRDLLQARGYVPRERRGRQRELAFPHEQWVQRGGALPASADLLIGGLADRVSGVERPYEALRARSSKRRVKGLDSEAWADALVPEIELLLALKLQTGRDVT